MESVCRQILLMAIFSVLYLNVKSQNLLPAIESKFEMYSSILPGEDETPVAQNDTLSFCANCGNLSASLNIMANDSKSHSDGFIVFIKRFPIVGHWELKSNGDFRYTNTNDFLGKLIFNYKIVKLGNNDLADEAQIIINILYDNDCDGIDDLTDVDDDNDGILDFDDGINADSDNDSIPNYLDIDSDNDGIPDLIEARPESQQIILSNTDDDGDGWDNVFDPDNGGRYFRLPDTDEDGTPDFLDLNSDNDEFSDFNEAYDADFDTIPDINYSNLDSDKDGLDESFDTIDGWLFETNSFGHNAPLPDFNSDGIRDWRDAIGKKPIPGLDNPLEPANLFITLYPNPATDFIKLDLPDEVLKENVVVQIFDYSGEMILEKEFIQNNSGIDISKLVSSVYLVQVISESYRFTSRIIVAH